MVGLVKTSFLFAAMFWNDDNEVFLRPFILFVHMFSDKSASSMKRFYLGGYPPHVVHPDFRSVYKQWVLKSVRSFVHVVPVQYPPEKRGVVNALCGPEQYLYEYIAYAVV